MHAKCDGQKPCVSPTGATPIAGNHLQYFTADLLPGMLQICCVIMLWPQTNIAAQEHC